MTYIDMRGNTSNGYFSNALDTVLQNRGRSYELNKIKYGQINNYQTYLEEGEKGRVEIVGLLAQLLYLLLIE